MIYRLVSLEVIGYASTFIYFMVVIATMTLCRYKRKQHRSEKRRIVPVKVQSSADLHDAGQDAKLRHLAQMPIFPKLELQEESITNKNYRTAKKRLGFKKHDPNDVNLSFNPPPKNNNLSVTFAKTCLVYVVYEEDASRGELEKEEHTQDLQHPNESTTGTNTS